MNKQLVEQIILEELETLSEMGELDEGILDKIKSAFSRAFMSKDQKFLSDFEKKNPALKIDNERDLQALINTSKQMGGLEPDAERYLSAKKAEFNAAAAMKKLDDSLPDNVAHGNNPLPYDVTNPPKLLDPITMFGTYGFVWDYSNASNGDMPRKYKPGARSGSGGARLFYRQMCRNGLIMYCPNRIYRLGSDPVTVTEPSPDAEPDESSSPDVPLSIYKRQKDEPSLRNAQGTVEMPLVTYMQKKLNLGPKAAQRILKGIAGTLKSRNIPIAESKLANLVVVTEETTETFFKRRGTPVKFDPRDYGKFLKRLSKDREKLKASIPELEKELEDAKKNPAYMGANIQLAQQALTRIKKQLGDFEKDAEAGVAKQKGMKADQKAKRKEIEAKAKKMPLVGRVLMTYAARSGSRAGEYDKAFFKALGDDKQQNKIIKSIEKILRRQMRRRGYDDSQIKSALKEGMLSGVLTESRETSIIRDTIKEIKKERLF